MTLSSSERGRKLRLVTEYLSFFKTDDLLYHYRDKPIVPGVCTEQSCDCIVTVGSDEEAGWCPRCDRDTLQSILIFAGVH